MIRRRLCRLPWWFRERTGIGLPPPGALVYATMRACRASDPPTGRWGHYVPRRAPETRMFPGGEVIVAGFVSRSQVLTVYDPRLIIDWYNPKENSL